MSDDHPALDADALDAVRAIDEAALRDVLARFRETVAAVRSSEAENPDGQPSPAAHAEYIAAWHAYHDAKRAFEATYGVEWSGVPAAPPAPPSQSLQFLPATQAAHVLTFNGRNRYEATLPNVTSVLAKQELAVLGFDTFRGQVMIAPAAAPSQWQPLTDTDMVRLREALERQGFAAIGKELMRDALQKVAEDNSYDSAVTWLNGLTWDGTPRIERFLSTYCGAVDDEYTRAVGRYIWTGLAARVFEPGCQLDMVVALQSKQGTRKSTGLQSIAPALEYFTDGVSLQDDDSDFKRLIRGKLVVEIAELAGLSKADVDLVKRVITRRVEEWVEKWQVLPTSYKRRCMLFASTNNEQFLPQDDTGQRRWLPVEIVMLDDQRIAADRAQLWAEGAALWRARKNAGEHGVDWKDAERLAAGRHQKYELSDVWEPLIEKWLNEPLMVESKVMAPPPRTRPLMISEVLTGAIHLTAAQMDARAEKRAGNVMRLLGFEKRSVRIDGRAHPVKRWMPKDV